MRKVMTLYLIRGLPGSGKSTLAKRLVGRDSFFEADQYFTDPVTGDYKFDPFKLRIAHQDCLLQTIDAMRSRYREEFFGETDRDGNDVYRNVLHDLRPVAVSNTFSQIWEMEPYMDLVKREEFADWVVCVIECQNNFGSVHGVPTEAIERMRNRWERT